MECNKKRNLQYGWNRYCTGLDKLAKIPLIGKAFRDDHFFGLYLGCPCKEHDINYSIEGKISKEIADLLFKQQIKYQAKIQNKIITGFFAAVIFYKIVKKTGFLYWKTWSSKWIARYK